MGDSTSWELQSQLSYVVSKHPQYGPVNTLIQREESVGMGEASSQCCCVQLVCSSSAVGPVGCGKSIWLGLGFDPTGILFYGFNFFSQHYWKWATDFSVYCQLASQALKSFHNQLHWRITLQPKLGPKATDDKVHQGYYGVLFVPI